MPSNERLEISSASQNLKVGGSLATVLLLGGMPLSAASAQGPLEKRLEGAEQRVEERIEERRDAQKKPNILVIMGDDIGWFNVGAYHHGIMSGKTPNLDKLASQGMRSPTIMPRRAARRVARTSSPASCRSAPA